MRILIAEDDLTSRILLDAVLKKAGHEVVQAVDGFEALEILKGPDAPKLAILDWMMPRMDGLDIVRALRAEQSNNPPYLIMLTTKTEKTDIIEGLNAGANDYLSKPFDPGELRARVQVGKRMIELQETLTDNLAELQDALDHVKTLRGIVPICASCKKIRDDQGYWQQVEAYVREHTDAEFSHGICPECAAKLYPQFYKARQGHDDAAGKDSVMGTIQDITDRKEAENIVAKALEEKNFMSRELHRRIKNGLSIIADLVSLEIGNHDNEKVRSALMSVNDRIRSLGNLYQLLYQTGGSRKVRLDRYLEIIVQSIVSSYLQNNERIAIRKDLDPMEIDVKLAVPLGLILSELLTNSLKHAFPGDMKGEVAITLSCCDPSALLKVSDTGAGLPQGFSMENASGLGMQIVGLLTEQLDGNLDIIRNGGTIFSLSIKMPGDRP